MRGRAWPVFGLLVLLFVINVIVGGVIVGVAGGISSGLVGSWLAGAVANALITPFIAIATTLVYFLLAGGTGPRPARARAGDVLAATVGGSARSDRRCGPFVTSHIRRFLVE